MSNWRKAMVNRLKQALRWGGSIYAWESYEILGLAGLGGCLLLLLVARELVATSGPKQKPWGRRKAFN